MVKKFEMRKIMNNMINIALIAQNDQLAPLYDQLWQQINDVDTIIIHRHVSPDPDALGSQLGLAQLIKDNLPEKNVYCVGEMIPNLKWIGDMDDIANDTYENALVIVIDTANSPRIDDSRYTLGKQTIKIDHHPVVEQYGQLNVEDTTASSASEMVALLAIHQQLTMSCAAARFIYTGICGDTGRFLFNNTTIRTMAIVTWLRERDFDATEVNQAMLTRSINESRLCGFVLQQLTFEDGVASVVLTHELLEQYELSVNETGSVVGLPGTIEGIVSWAIFVQNPDLTYRVRLRSKGPIINQIAAQFNGGGHPLASGANAQNEDEINQIVNALKIAVKQYEKEGFDD